VDIAKKKGLEFWGIASLADWGSPADCPGFNEFPFNCESKLRIENPQWAPTDKYGYRRQGGTIEFAYPEARKAVVDLLANLSADAGYDGITFLTYCENFSQRFQDEFGYSEPIVKEFKKRHGIDIRNEPFNKFGSKYDWYRLRGEYVTLFFKELKEALSKHKIKLAIMINPMNPRKPMTWATLPQEYATMGNIYFDVETWVREGIMDRLQVYGAASGQSQIKAIDDLLWLTRNTKVSVDAITSSPYAPHWAEYKNNNVSVISALSDEEQYLARCGMQEFEISILKDGTIYEKMKFLAQVSEGKSAAELDDLLPLLKEKNIILIRLVLKALGRNKNPEALDTLEKYFFDPEIGIRCAALKAVQHQSRPQTIGSILKAVEKYPDHPTREMVRNVLPRLNPFPYDELYKAVSTHKNDWVRNIAIAGLAWKTKPENLPSIRIGLNDKLPYTRFLAAHALSFFRENKEAAELLLAYIKDPDAAIANKIAQSMGEVILYNAKDPSRGAFLHVLTNRFLQFGDGYKGTDAEWGHRAVGTSLLVFEEGEAFLQKCLMQSADKRLAEMAWQVLYFREKKPGGQGLLGDNAFNLISEIENDKAYAARPIHMFTETAERMKQNFEDTAIFNNAAVTVGDVNGPGGRWMGFTVRKGPVSTSEKVYSGTQAVKLTRGGQALTGWITKAVPPNGIFLFTAQMFRVKESSFLIYLRDSVNTDSLGLHVLDSGAVRFRTKAGSWQDTGLSMPEEKWVQIRITGDSRIDMFSLELNDGKKSTFAPEMFPLSRTTGVSRVFFTMQQPDSSVLYIDDIILSEKK